MSVYFTSLIGKRDSNEDQHDIFINLDNKDKTKAPINFYGVYDGHGGKFVSKFLHDNLSDCFTDKRMTYPVNNNIIKKLYTYIQNKLRTNYTKFSYNTGSTCLVAIQFKSDNSEYLNVINTGDSRCVLCRNNIGIALSKDHKPNWPEEKLRIKELGGEIVWDGYDWRIEDLSVSRAFGDCSAEPFVTNIPDIFKYKLTNNDKFMVLACDGLWDVMCNQEVVNYVLSRCYDMKTNKRVNVNINIARELGQYAIKNKGSTDNVSIIIVFFQ